MQSLYNRGIYIDFTYPNKLQLKGSGNVDINLKRFVIEKYGNKADKVAKIGQKEYIKQARAAK